MRQAVRIVLLTLAFVALVLIGSAIEFQLESRQNRLAAETLDKNRERAAASPVCREGHVAVRLLVEPQGSGYDRVCIQGYRP